MTIKGSKWNKRTKKFDPPEYTRKITTNNNIVETFNGQKVVNGLYISPRNKKGLLKTSQTKNKRMLFGGTCECGHTRANHSFDKQCLVSDKDNDCPCLFFRPDNIVRDVKSETKKVQTGKSEAFSSERKLYYHDIPTELIRRVAKRHNVGHVKYNDNPVPIAMNLNWRIGLDDPLYVMDRLNHVFDHLMDFMDNGDANDDNLGAIAWNIGFLMEVERLHPNVLREVIGQSKYSGEIAAMRKKELQDDSRGEVAEG